MAASPGARSRRREGEDYDVHDYDDNTRSDEYISVMFPTSTPGQQQQPRPRRPSEAGSTKSNKAARSFAQQTMARNTAFSDTDTVMNGMKAYGDFDDVKSIKSTHMAGSRPGSPRARRPETTAFSITSGATTDGNAAYLYLHEPAARSSRPQVVPSPGPSRVQRGKRPQTPILPPVAASMQGSLVDEEEGQPGPGPMMEQRGQTLQAPRPAYGDMRKSSRGSDQVDLSPLQAWYLLRTLVGLEVSNEASKLHRLSNLSPGSRSQRYGGDNGFVYDEDEDASALEMPILRYLVKHFLLTLPYVRDVDASSVDLSGGRRPEKRRESESDIPYYWRAGVLPILRALYSCDLSHPVEQGRRSLGSIVFGIYGAHAVERFVASGLRIVGPATENPLARAGAYSPLPVPPMSRTTENPFTRTGGTPAPLSARGQQKTGFSGIFRRMSTRNSVGSGLDLAGPAPRGHLEPISNELDSEVDSDEEDPDETLAAVQRQKAEEALVGRGDLNASKKSLPSRTESLEARSSPKPVSEKRHVQNRSSGDLRDSTTSSQLVAATAVSQEAGRRAFMAQSDKRGSGAQESSEVGDDMVTAEDDGGDHTGRISHLTDRTTFTASEGRPSDAVTAPESRNSAVTAPESQSGEMSIDKDVTPTDQPRAGFISSVVGYFAGTSAVDPPTPFQESYEEQPPATPVADQSHDRDDLLPAIVAPTVGAASVTETPRSSTPQPRKSAESLASIKAASETSGETAGGVDEQEALNDAPTETEDELTMRAPHEEEDDDGGDTSPSVELPGTLFGGDIPPAPILTEMDRIPGTHHAFSSEGERYRARPASSIKGYEVPESEIESRATEDEVPMARSRSKSILFPGDSAATPKDTEEQAPVTSTPPSPARSRGRDPPTRDESEEPPAKKGGFANAWSPSRRPPRQSSTNAKIPSDKEIKRQREKADKEAKRAQVSATGEEPRKRRFTLSSLTNQLRKSDSKGNIKGQSSPQPQEPVPRYTQPTNPPPKDRDWYAGLNLPSDFLADERERLERERTQEEELRRAATPARSASMPAFNDYGSPMPSKEVEGHAWPWGASVPFWKGTPVNRVAWGGFEADVVGVRKGFTGHAFIVRVRRPQRLDEYVLRDESQFRKYLGVIEKQYPHAHLRRVPEGKVSAFDDAIDPQAFLLSREDEKRRSRAPQRAATDGGRGSDDEQETERPERPVRQTSRLSMRLKDASSARGGPSSAARSAPGGNRKSAYEPRRGPPANRLPPRLEAAGPDGQLQDGAAPYLDAERRALRGWLRDTLSVRTMGHNRETAAFLLLGGIRLREPEIRDVAHRQRIDEARRNGRIGVAQGAADRAKVAHTVWASVLQECVQGDGLLAMSEALRDSSTISALPSRFQKSIEWARLTTAQMIHDLLIAGEHSAPFFAKLRSLHASIPWFLLRNAFKLPNPGLVIKALQDILLSRRFGKQSLLQKALLTILDDDPEYLNDQIEACRARIQSTAICEKLTRFVYAPREVKDMIRKHAADNNMELVVTIARGADEPKLDRYDLERVVRAARVYKSFMKKNPTPLAKVKTENGSVRLILDMQVYLRLLSRERDATELRGLLSNERTIDAMQVCLAPILEFLKRAYKVTDMPTAIGDMQKFLDQLIVIVDALRSRIQDPQKAVRVIARLLARHQAQLYAFLHQLHREDSSIEEVFQWLWTATTFLRRGLAEQVDLVKLMPRDADERRFLLEELDSVVEYHKRKRQRQYELMCRRFASDLDGDDPVIVEGDGNGKSKTEPLIEVEPRVPRLYEIPRMVDSFRNALVSVMGV